MDSSKMIAHVQEYIENSSQEISEAISVVFQNTAHVRKDSQTFEEGLQLVDDLLGVEGKIAFEMLELQRLSWELTKIQNAIEGPTAAMTNLRKNIDNVRANLVQFGYSYKTAWTSVRDRTYYVKFILDLK